MSTEMEMIQLVLIRECLRKQLEEYELLQSMYSNPGEFQTDNPNLIDDIRDFLTGMRKSVNEKLDYRIKLIFNDKIKMELSIILSQHYPTHEIPMFMIRTDSLSKQQETAIKKAIENYIETEVDKNDPYVFQIITWLQDNFDDIVQISGKDTQVSSIPTEESNDEIERVWLWSHHIYSKIKRQDIMKLTKDYDLNGFMWPGKPGVICFEGATENVEDVVKIIKGWQWQKLKIVKIEKDDVYRFDKFRDILSNQDDGENAKMDSSAFFKYLESHNSAHMKKELFGLD